MNQLTQSETAAQNVKTRQKKKKKKFLHNHSTEQLMCLTWNKTI